MVLRLLAPAAAVALLLVAPAAAQTAPELPAQVRVAAGVGAGFVRVHLPRPVAAHGGRTSDGRIRLRMRGGEGMRGILLRAEASGGEGWPAGQTPRLGFITGGSGDVDVVLGAGLPALPSGDYRLYVHTQGAPTTVELDLPDLAGSGSLALTDGVRMSGGVLESRSAAADRAALGRTLDLGAGEIEVLIARDHRFAAGQTGFVAHCDVTDGSTCPDDGGLPPAGRAASGSGGSVGSLGLTGPVRLDVGISGSSVSGPPPALGGHAWAVEFDVPDVLGPQPPLAEAPLPPVVPRPAADEAPRPGVPSADAVAPVRRRAARLGLSCSAATSCSGTARLRHGTPVRFRIAGGGRAVVRLPLTGALRRALARRRSVRAVVVVRIPGSPGVRRSVTIRR